MSPDAVLFDLDGTLTDPKPGIERSIIYALDRMGLPAPTEDLGWCIGPPLAGSFERLLGTTDPATIARALGLYRERFTEIGLYENAVYDGVPDCLIALLRAGKRLFVATSKPLVFATRILDHFALADLFDAVHGSGLDGSLSDKGELIASLLSVEGLAPDRTIMIGDREHDGIGAAKNGVRFVGVTYGYGTAERLLASGAIAFCASPEEVARAVSELSGALCPISET